MKTAHVKTVDGTTVTINLKDLQDVHDFREFIYDTDNEMFFWWEDDVECYIYRSKVIFVKIKED